jgi:iron only hydrogenase large subunit-like protein
VITFEELQALFDSRNIDITKLPEENLNDASYFGRVFARSGGLAIAVAEGIKEHGYDFELRAVSCNGIEECKKTLLKLKANADVGNFIEGMACYGGCIGGAGCLTHGEKNRKDIDKYAEQSTNKKLQTEMPLP